MDKDIYDGQKVYTPLTLPTYDLAVSLNNRFFWKVDQEKLVDQYRENLTPNHLEIGVGTGSMILRANPSRFENLALADINTHSLAATARNLVHYEPKCYELNALEPMPAIGSFSSIACNYLLHCVPGVGFAQKAAIFDNAFSLLDDNGVFFGATICGKEMRWFDLGFYQNIFYNKLGWFHNLQDSATDLNSVLRSKFWHVDVVKQGHVAFFRATKLRS